MAMVPRVPMPLSYQEALDFLFPRTTTIKFGLATTRALLKSLGNPHEVMPSVHIGGTNGKGSVCALVAAALREAGWRVGLYTSPHLISFRERIQVDGVPISEEAVAMWTGRLLSPILERKATFFEATTALAFADFAARGVEIAVVEVGLGGRLDSTNVVRPLVSGVTKIARDHMKYLGDSLELIACEKAGIAKPGVPFVIGEADPALVQVLRREAIRACARAQTEGNRGRADVRVLPAEYEWRGPLSLAGPHQRRNAAVAHGILAAIPAPYRPTQEQLERAFGSTRVSGRLDRRGRWLFDVAHNPDGMRSLVTALQTIRPPARCTRWFRSWATRNGRRCWCSSTRSSIEAFSRLRQRRRRAGGTSSGCVAGCATRRGRRPMRSGPWCPISVKRSRGFRKVPEPRW